MCSHTHGKSPLNLIPSLLSLLSSTERQALQMLLYDMQRACD